LTGPYSIGVAYYGSCFDRGVPLEETWAARAGSEDFAGLTSPSEEYRPGAARYEVGESANFVLVPMLIAGLEQVSSWGVERIGAYIGGLTKTVVHDLRLQAAGLQALGAEDAHVFGLRLPPDVDPAVIAGHLRSRAVHVSVRGRTIRVAPHVYNDEDDIEALLDGLVDAVRSGTG
jgi:selenocysteine lyase/cysteine desulfurase